ncbi:MAG: DUF2141 domain-containing protein [Bacteroidetes bacterium]|nr:DUF2141 domain-containing protein [Fibrella sp.]
MHILKILPAVFLLSLGLISLTASESLAQGTLDIKIANIRKNSGKVVVEIYNSKASWLKTPVKKLELAPNQASQTASFQIPYGKYAITVYQDINTNGETDMNFIGIPKEPVGFGNNYKPFGEPKFESCAIDFNPTSKPQEIKLYKVL